MSVATWCAGLWPVAVGAALLLFATPSQPGPRTDLDAPKTILAPLPEKGGAVADGIYREAKEPGAIRLVGGSGDGAFRAATNVFDVSFQVGLGAAESLDVTFDLASLAPAADDPGPRETFDRRLGAALGAVAVGPMRLEARCIGSEQYLAGAAHRARWRGEIRWDRATTAVEFFLWHCRQGDDRLQALGSFGLDTTRESTIQRTPLEGALRAARVSIGLDLRLRPTR